MSWNQLAGGLASWPSRARGVLRDLGSGVPVWNRAREQVAAVVHPVVQDANHQDAYVVRLEEDVMATAGGYLDPRPDVATRTRDHRAPNQTLHRVPKGIHVIGRFVLPPSPRGVPTN